METAKEKIKIAVSEYKKLFPDEYQRFLKSAEIKIGQSKDKWASTGGDGAVERHLYDTPEKLHGSIGKLLTSQELEWFNGRGEWAGEFHGARWFMETFPEFKISKDF